jgi:glycosyltransferase involved in cell wall biosynthesis
MRRVIISVVSDLVTDQRVHRTATTLQKGGMEVTLVGRQMKKSLPLDDRSYKTKRFRLLAEKGFWFYACYNIRLFFYLLFHKSDVLVANDLDTLLPNYLVSKIKGAELFYDSHEFFTEVPELVSRPSIQRVWKRIERFIFPKLKNVFTVNQSIASLYENEYHKKVFVVRNVPMTSLAKIIPKTKEELNLPSDKKVILFQGAGINIQRGAEEALQAMQFVDDAILLFIGNGDVIDELKKMRNELDLSEKIFFIPKMPMNEVRAYTMLADIGLSLDKDTNSNYKFSLPNKLFDYIHAGVPVLASPLVEVKKIVDEFKIGMTIDNYEPKHIAACINVMLKNPQQLAQWKENTKLAALELCWEKEEKVLLKIFHDVI